MARSSPSSAVRCTKYILLIYRSRLDALFPTARFVNSNNNNNVKKQKQSHSDRYPSNPRPQATHHTLLLFTRIM